MLSLPIDTIQDDFCVLLADNHMVVQAETGSGKSTRLPVWAKRFGRVLVIEPRRIACTSLAEYVADLENCQLGEQIGYAIKLDVRCTDNSDIVFVTPGVALQWYVENQLSDFAVVMVDEFHERRWDTDLLVALLKKAANHRLIVTSATLDSEKIAHYLQAKRLIAKGRNYQVSTLYRSRESHFLPEVYNLERRVKEEVHRLELDGDILVFLPGRKEISACQAALNGLDDWIVAPLHASVSDQQRHVALNVQPQRKIVLATNVAETSLTIPNITAVIDSGLERRNVQRNGRTALILTHISKASAQQRTGRAGRVRDGVCVRLYGQYASLENVTPPQMQRESLVDPVLAAAACGYRLDDLDWLDVIPEKALFYANEQLVLMEALDEAGNITAHGRQLATLPIDPLYADLVSRIEKKATKEAMIDLTAALSVPAALYSLPKGAEELESLSKSEPYSCDVSILINLVRGKYYPEISVDTEAIKEAKGLASQMRSAFALPDLSVASTYVRHALAEAIVTLHPELLFVRRVKRRETMGNGVMEVQIGKHSRLLDKSESVLVLDTHSLSGRGVKQTVTIATVTMPVPLEFIGKHGLGEWQQGETALKNGELLSQLELVYAGRIISTKQVEAQGGLSVKPVLDAVMSGKLLGDFAVVMTRKIDHWRLYVELGYSDVKDHHNVTFTTWFTQQLHDLEVQSLHDIALFSADDFAFDGIPDWEYSEFAQAHPLELTLAGVHLSVEYDTAKRRICVTYCSGLRKDAPKRWELPKWSGWRIQYKKASKTVDIR
ncbi:DEAD/DEAH box helicase [Vibrio profundum]|uniref:helicase-related protein n=1 Tax=Vibrio profundum TaxID=2910247 RepID=UPI003D1487D5